MDRHEIIDWMDAVAPLWKGADYETQRFVDQWWWDLFDYLKFEAAERCPGMIAKNKGKSER